MKSFPPTELKINNKFHQATQQHPLLKHSRGILIFLFFFPPAAFCPSERGKKTHKDSEKAISLG